MPVFFVILGFVFGGMFVSTVYPTCKDKKQYTENEHKKTENKYPLRND